MRFGVVFQAAFNVVVGGILKIQLKKLKVNVPEGCHLFSHLHKLELEKFVCSEELWVADIASI